MWNWFVQNKEWLLSGIVIAVLGVIWSIIKSFLEDKSSNAVIRAPVITVSPTIHFPKDVSSAPTSGEAAHVSGEADEDKRPKLYSLHPRICSVTVRYNGSGFAESGESFEPRAAIATFRMAKPSADGNDTYITARLSYRMVADVGWREASKEIHRVNNGAWLNEDYNSVEMGLPDTKEVILFLRNTGRCFAVQDNRHSVAKYGSPTIYEFSSTIETLFVDVLLVDDKYGTLITYTYEIKTDPLTVSEIILVPRVGY
jgi:hypothetical protein